MGKIRIKRKTHRLDPIGPRKTEAPSTTNQALETSISTILEQLKNLDAEENLLGLKKLSGLFSNQENITGVKDGNEELNRKCIMSASSFLTNQRTDIKQAAVHALRNLSAVTDTTFSDILVEDDVMINLITLIQEYASDWSQKMDSEEEQCSQKEREKLDTLIQTVHLISNLCEVNYRAVSKLNSSNVLPILWRFINPSFAGIDLALCVAQCFLTISEDNEDVLKHLKRTEDEIAILLSIENENHQFKFLHLNLLSAGLLLNIHGDLPMKYLNKTFDLLERVVKLDPKPEICKLSSQIPLDKEAVLASDDVLLLEKLVDIVNLLTTAFEILTNVCSSEEEEDSMEVECEDESDDMACSTDIPRFMNQETNINSDIYKALVKSDFLALSINKTAALPDNVTEILRNHLDTEILVKKLQVMRSRSFHFLNNLLLILDKEAVGDSDRLFSLWSQTPASLVSLVENRGSPDNEELLEAITAAMRGLISHLVCLDYPAFKNTTLSELELIFNIGKSFLNSTSICSNVIQIVSTLGVYFAKQELEELLKAVGSFLMCIINDPKCNVCIMAEALDASMDVFAEDNTDAVLKSLKIVNQIANIEQKFYKKVRKERQNLGDYGPLISTVKTNLPEFLSYKTNRKLK